MSSVHDALSELREHAGKHHGLGDEHREIVEQVGAALAEHISESNRELLHALEKHKSDHADGLTGLRKHVSELNDASELQKVIHASSRETAKDIVNEIKNAVDHSPLLE